MAVREDGTDAPPRADFTSGDGAMGTQNSPTAEAEADSDALPSALPFQVLERKNAEYDAEYWSKCQALYAGGRALFKNERLLKSLFPQHRNEPPDVYAERLKRAFYIAYPGEIIDYIVSGLMTDPVELMAETTPDNYYDAFFEDTSMPGGEEQSLNQLLRQQILTALQCRTAWTQVDFPNLDTEEIINASHQEDIGALDAYAFPLAPEQVFDWCLDGSKALVWAKVCIETQAGSGVAANPDVVTRTYTIYNRVGWARYSITFHVDKPPKGKAMVPLDDVGEHSFGKVPLLRMELPEGLWAMSKLEGMAAELFNKRCALSWAEYKSLFQERHEFLAPPDPMAGGPAIADDEGRATNQVHGIGWTQERYAGDRVEFIGPDSAPFGHAMKSCEQLRDEMHRVTYQMALATDVGSAALRQSGDSKKENRAAHGVVLMGLGEYVRAHAKDIARTVSAGRQDVLEWTASGMSKFETADLSTEIEDAEKLEGIDIPSPTFQRRHKYALAKAKLGDEASEEDLQAIEDELESAFTPEQLGAGGELLEMSDEERAEAEAMDEEFTAPRQDQGRRGFQSRPTSSNGA